MLGKLAKAVAYVKAPAKTFAVLHPLRAVKYGLAFVIGKKLYDGLTSKARERQAGRSAGR